MGSAVNASAPVSLDHLRWHRVRVTLRNLRNQFASEHPLWIFHGVFMYAAPKTPQGEPLCKFFFHPVGGPLPPRVAKGRDYVLDVIFPVAEPTLPAAFLENLARHLRLRHATDPGNNFALIEAGAPELRSLAALLAEQPRPPDETEEACLEFVTPLAYKPGDDQRKWLFTVGELCAAMRGRWQKLFGVTLLPEEADWKGLELLPYYWEYEKHRHRPKSSRGEVYLNGNTGPLYLRGPVAQLWPWLAMGSELHAGLELPAAQGCYQLRLHRPFFDARLLNPSCYEAALVHLSERSDLVEELAQSLDDRTTVLKRLAAEVREGMWPPTPARGFKVKKANGDERMIALLAARDHLVHKVLQEALAPVLDRAFERASFGFRPGKSAEDVRAAIEQAVREGYGYLLESDIQEFFDQVDWELLWIRLDRHLPRADVVTRRVLRLCVEHPLQLNGQPVNRTKGLLQGSPLSPLLSNLYLDHFDEQMESRGFRLIRYADDFLVFGRTVEECERALAAVQEILAALKLTVKDAKTTVTPFDAGFTFVGLQFGQGLEAGLLARAALKKTVFLRHEFAFVGVDHDALVVRKDDALLARLPLRRVGELILLGASGVSTRLVEKCDRLDIPITFCAPGGRFISTIAGSDRSHYEMAHRHAQRREALTETEVLAIARRLVTAKLSHYGAWLSAASGGWADQTLTAIDQSLLGLAAAPNLETVLGWEGHSAAAIFCCLNRRVRTAEFQSPKREPHCQPDRWNSLLDWAYSLMFSRLNTLLRTRGLCPFLGFLHSPVNRFESLVCDLQEPFRARMDRMVLKLVNLQMVKPEDFKVTDEGRFFLKSEPLARCLEAFEQEMETRLASEPGTLRQLLLGQVQCVQDWVNGTGEMRFHLTKYQPGRMSKLG